MLGVPERPAGLAELAAICGDVGETFGAIAGGPLYSNVEEFAAAVTRGELVGCFVAAVLQSWDDKYRRRTLGDARAAWGGGDRVGWVLTTMQAAFGVYCSFRRSAKPRKAEHPSLAGEESLHIPRRLQAALRNRGLLERRTARGATSRSACGRSLPGCGAVWSGDSVSCGWTTTTAGGCSPIPRRDTAH